MTNNESLIITKRDGTSEPFNIDKLHKVVQFACDGLAGTSASEVELHSKINFVSKMKTSDIQETLIKSAALLISEDQPNYQYVAGRLINYHLRKAIYGSLTPPPLFEHVQKVVDAGFYDPAFLKMYNFEEWSEINSFIKHDRDYNLTYAAMEQFRGKYLVKNRVTGEIFETPQMAMILIAAFLFQNYPKATRLFWIRDFYNALSDFQISLPSPIMAGVRTPERQFASCVLIDSEDSIDSIFTTAHAIGRYVTKKAGIGINGGRIRSIGSKVRNGDAFSTGVLPFYRLWQSATRSCSQGGIRAGAATLHCPIWHAEIEDILVLKNNKGTDQNRLREMDYSIQFNKLMYERLLEGGHITLFSPADVPEVYEAFFKDQDKFKELYERAERNPRIKKRKIPAIELFSNFIQERKDTGRIYLMNVDHCNSHSSFDEKSTTVYMSNLCQEITLPTKSIKSVDDTEGEIATCILGAVNWGLIKEPKDFEKPCMLLVRALDELIDLQEYPVKAAEVATRARRSLGVGIINFAYWLAKNDLSYQDIDEKGLEKIDEFAEAWSYYLIRASADLAKEKGACDKEADTKYGQGILPIDTYKNEVDELVKPNLRMPWKELRSDLAMEGIRNSTLMALMPSESSAQLSNSTNGIEPPRSLVSFKQSKDGVLAQVVPEIRRLKNKYDLLWDQKSPLGYLKIVAVLQKWIDQSISTNTSYNPAFYKDNQIPLSELLKDVLFCYKMGLKTLYYFNLNDQAGEAKMDQEMDCDACKI